jgi:hypothetical protein
MADHRVVLNTAIGQKVAEEKTVGKVLQTTHTVFSETGGLSFEADTPQPLKTNVDPTGAISPAGGEVFPPTPPPSDQPSGTSLISPLPEVPQQVAPVQSSGAGTATGVGDATAVGAAMATSVGIATATAVADVQPITISPTIYSSGPDGIVIVANILKITITGNERREFTTTLHDIAEQVQGSNNQSPEVRQQLAGELRAGAEIFNTPKPDRGALIAYLVHPLRFIAKEFLSGTIPALASKALEKLLTWLGLS